MNAPFNPSARVPTPRNEVREAVRDLLMKSEAFAAMPPEKQRQLAQDLALVSDYLVAPEGIEGNRIPGGLGVHAAQAMADPVQEGTFKEHQSAVSEIGKAGFDAGAVNAGVAAAVNYVEGINFPKFVGGLIHNVFDAIVATSISQMEEFSKMVGSVAKSLEEFMKDNVSENAGRDHVKNKFPEMFEIGQDDTSDTPQPRLKVREGVDESIALARVNSSISFENGELKSLDLSDENVERALVVGARMQLAKQRQQMMASTVLLGINRIVVTSGKIKAKVNFQFQARSGRDLSRSAQAMDVARDKWGNVQSTYAGAGTYDGNKKGTETHDKDGAGESSSESYAKGTYQYENRPVITAMSTATEGTTEQLQAKADLMGDVEISFKSDYLPLDKMATPGMIAAIQGNSTPVDPNVVPSARIATPPPVAAAPAPAAVAPRA